MADKQRYKVRDTDFEGRTIAGINYPPNNLRAGAGSVVDDIPRTSLQALLDQKVIEPTDAPLNRIVDVDLTFAPAEDVQPPVPAAPAAPAKKEG